jgi:putrescine transport system permease protein
LNLDGTAVAASAAVVLGTLTGMALARFGPFRGRTLLSGMATAPLVMPEVITGLSLLLLWVVQEPATAPPGPLPLQGLPG